MLRRVDVFRRVLRELEASGALSRLMLAGSWCQLVYNQKFPDQIPLQKTRDLDFLVRPRLGSGADVDVPQLLKGLGFRMDFSQGTGMEKFVLEDDSLLDMEVEFLTNLRKTNPVRIPELHLMAQGLAYVDVILNNATEMSFEGVAVTVPQPGAFALHKLHISTKRRNPDKREKDAAAAVDIAEFLIANHADEARAMKEIFGKLPRKWQAAILSAAEKRSPVISGFLAGG